MKVGLQLKANLENLTNLTPEGNDFRWYLKFKCSNCGEISEKWQYVTSLEKVALKGGRGEANMVIKCKLCSRENSIDIIKDSVSMYTDADNNTFKTFVQFECRGVEPVDFSLRSGFKAEGLESRTVFSDINFEENEWVDYDEKSKQSVGIYEVSHRFQKL